MYFDHFQLPNSSQLDPTFLFIQLHNTTYCISLIKFNLYCLNTLQCGACPEAWSTYLGYTLKGNCFFSQQLSNTPNSSASGGLCAHLLLSMMRLEFYGSHACCHSLWGFLYSVARLCLENTVFL